MNLLDQGLALQAASIGTALADYEMRKVPCRACRGYGCGEDQDGRSTGTCPRCDGRGWVEIRLRTTQNAGTASNAD